MDSILVVYLLVFSVALAVVLNALRGHGSLSRNWAKVRVRVEENRPRSISEQPEEELDDGSAGEIAILGAILLFLYMLLSKG